MNDSTRIVLAFELETVFHAEACKNQRIGGQFKGSSNLTEATIIDVRKEVAAAAGVSVGNITKVKQILASAIPEMISALKSGELSIHMAWEWSKMDSRSQLRQLNDKRDQLPIPLQVRPAMTDFLFKSCLSRECFPCSRSSLYVTV